MEGNTKERILQEALKLFSRRGYEAVSMSDIAGRLSITKPALYKHYKSKQEILDSIVQRMEDMDRQRALEYEVPEGTMEEMETKYEETSPESIREFCRSQFLYWTEDAFASDFRRMLTLEQYRNTGMKELYHQYLGSGPVEYMEDLFTALSGSVREARQKAVEFYGPMYLLYDLYDAAKTDEEKKQMVKMLEMHLDKYVR